MRARLSALIVAWCLLAPLLITAERRGADVVIRRDTFGVPHILADTEEGAARALGYATAEDHGEALARLFVRARGEQARLFGARFVEEDFELRLLALRERAAQQLETLPPLTQRLLSGYAAGYNAYLAKHPKQMPAWAAPIEAADVLAHCYAVLLLDFSSVNRGLLRGAIAPKTPPPTASPAEPLLARGVEPVAEMGSNMWALGRGRTRSGHGILLANPHLRWSGSHLFHEVHIRVPGRVDVAGATLIGFPVVGIGFNEHGGWTHTVNSRDADDLYALTLDPADPQRYLYDGLSLPLTRRTLSVDVKSATGTGVETVTREVVAAHYGPIVRRTGDQVFALKSANVTAFDFLTTWNLMAKARSTRELWDALQLGGLPMFNVAYTNRQGELLYLFNGRIPFRPSGYDWSGTVAGDTSATEWYRMRTAQELPHLLNPPGGYLQNCNDAPWFTTLRKAIARDTYPPELTRDGLGLRGQFSLRTLDAATAVTLDRVKSLKWDDRVLVASRVKADLIAAVQRAPDTDADADGALRDAAAVLAKWDDRASAGSRGAVLFLRWWDEYSKTAKKAFAVEWTQARLLTTPRGLAEPKTAVTALAAAARAIIDEHGSLDVAWGDVHRIRRGGEDLPASGAPGSFRTLGFGNATEGRRAANFGDSYVLAVEFTPTPTAFSIMAYSQSDDPSSPHRVDQTRLFARGEYKPLWFAEADVTRHVVRTYTPDE
jgi:acyl-homoserine-lactone acylase